MARVADDAACVADAATWVADDATFAADDVAVELAFFAPSPDGADGAPCPTEDVTRVSADDARADAARVTAFTTWRAGAAGRETACTTVRAVPAGLLVTEDAADFASVLTARTGAVDRSTVCPTVRAVPAALLVTENAADFASVLTARTGAAGRLADPVAWWIVAAAASAAACPAVETVLLPVEVESQAADRTAVVASGGEVRATPLTASTVFPPALAPTDGRIEAFWWSTVPTAPATACAAAVATDRKGPVTPSVTDGSPAAPALEVAPPAGRPCCPPAAAGADATMCTDRVDEVRAADGRTNAAGTAETEAVV
ncbi:hypothetical protein [Amnibacterium sp.]|uniref:hypothetical protein n=1 Tax=Amnibacterium sp. TaxID=1872496 RepID=UPI00262B9880|nr:hypothetical protein [Amnibacterium sp.]MCU1474265.1 hypothetical protein [Amnibacterium sp.]